MNVKKLEKAIAAASASIDELAQARAQTADKIDAIGERIEQADAGQIAALSKEKGARLAELRDYTIAYEAQERRRDEAQRELDRIHEAEAKDAARDRLRANVKRLGKDVLEPLTAIEATLREMERTSAKALAANAKYGADVRSDDLNFHQLCSGYPGDKLREVIRLFNDINTQLAKV